jgi:hypothetical protein
MGGVGRARRDGGTSFDRTTDSASLWAAWAKARVGQSPGVQSVSPAVAPPCLTAERRRRRGEPALAGGARATGDGFAAVAGERRLKLKAQERHSHCACYVGRASRRGVVLHPPRPDKSPAHASSSKAGGGNTFARVANNGAREERTTVTAPHSAVVPNTLCSNTLSAPPAAELCAYGQVRSHPSTRHQPVSTRLLLAEHSARMRRSHL